MAAAANFAATRLIPPAVSKLCARRRMQKLKRRSQIHSALVARTPRSFFGGGREPDFCLRSRRGFPGGLGCCRLALRLGQRRTPPAQTLARPGLEKPIVCPHRAAAGCAAGIFCASPFAARERHHAAHRRRRARSVGRRCRSVQSGALRLGIVACTMAGSVAYSRRFYEEVLREPATASPLVFPETVFNAPASHLAAYLGTLRPVTRSWAMTELFCRAWRSRRTGC